MAPRYSGFLGSGGRVGAAGYWGPPLRLGPAPEITELTLVAAQEPG